VRVGTGRWKAVTATFARPVLGLERLQPVVDRRQPFARDLEADSMVLTVESPRGALVFAPEERADGTLAWHCSGGIGVRAAQLPPLCREEDAPAER
jgi:hypothetical protein